MPSESADVMQRLGVKFKRLICLIYILYIYIELFICKDFVTS